LKRRKQTVKWADEAIRRRNEVRSGKVQPVPAAEGYRRIDAALLSEAALAEDWNRAEENAAWAYLQPAKSP
jgi:hypothetical protein